MGLNGKWIFGIILSIIFLVIALTFFFSTKNLTTTSPIQTELEQCETLFYNGEDKINILFFSEKKEAETYMDVLLDSEPLTTHKDQFNAFYINNPEIIESECESYKGIAILCYSKNLIKKAGSCPNDFIVVLKKEDPEIRASAYFNVMSINTELPKTVLAHELGHAAFNLAEEYVPANLPSNQPNCKETCEEFDFAKDGCFEGCSRSSYIRSVENGVMKTLRTDYYGLFNQKVIENIILETIEENQATQNKITGEAIDDPRVFCQDEKYYSIQFQDNQIMDKSLEIGCAPENIRAGPLSYTVSSQDEILSSGNFNNLIFTESQGIDNEQIQGDVFESDQPITLAIPQQPQAQNFQIFDSEGNQLIETSLNEIGAEPCLIN